MNLLLGNTEKITKANNRYHSISSFVGDDRYHYTLNKPFTAFHSFSVHFSWTNGMSYIIFELSDNLKINVL